MESISAGVTGTIGPSQSSKRGVSSIEWKKDSLHVEHARSVGVLAKNLNMDMAITIQPMNPDMRMIDGWRNVQTVMAS